MDAGEQRRRWEYWWFALCFFLLLCFGRQVSAQIRYTIQEEVKEGAIVGNIAKDLSLDVKTLVDRRFRIVSGSNDALFQVNQNNGILYVHKRIDREELCDGIVACLISLKTVVENPLEVHYVEVEITDVNDHAPGFADKDVVLEIAESTPPGEDIPLQEAQDPDFGLNSVRFYKLSQTENFELELRENGGDKKVPILKLRKMLDRERQIKHSLTLTAIDGGNPPRSGSVIINVTVLDDNDNRPKFSQEVYSITLQENAHVDTLVIQLNATDLDEGQNAEIIYSFIKNIERLVYNTFNLNNTTGEIRVKSNVDFEKNDVYRVGVIAADKGQPPKTSNCRIIIKVIDVNDNRPEIDVTSLSDVVPEDAKPGTVIALVSITDKDSDVNGKVVCRISNNVPFELKPSFKENMYSLVTSAKLDRELVSHYDVTIRSTDLGQPPLSSVKTLTVQISDVNDNVPEFPRNPLELYLMENNPPGASIYSVSAIDKDLNENAAITYQIIREDGGKSHIAQFLNVNSDNGNIYALKSFDYETVKKFQFHVLATDSGSPSLSSNVTVNVFILDQNDNVPVILYPVSANGSAEGVEEIPRNVNAGHLVTKVRAYDADIGYNGWLLFSLQEVSEHSLFGLDRYTGQIRTLRSFTETDEAQHKLVILVKDNGNVSLSATATVIVKVVEPKEAFAASDVKNAVKDEEENHVTFYLILTLGSVSVLFLISIIVLIVMQCSKSTDCSSKYLQEANYDGTLCHSIQYRSGDKRYMLVGPRMSLGSTIVPGSNGNTLVIPDRRSRRDSGEVS
ncbi:protocadherin alpha-8-like [Xyrauchen texanus]|uniref:protocadherin alpha-8-like n=1 Tax=Xyrauchen texanus TaxID=154827 RepID=UPI002242726C|nr:protocadherin alpha-8-like [Xyrauchen texanus]